MNAATPVIAVVDDDSVYQFTARRTLKATNLTSEILQFNNGNEALNFLKASPAESQLPDIIFLDINMPGTDGWTFMEEFHKMKSQFPKEIQVYMVSSSIDPRDISRARKTPDVTEYMEKPVSMGKFAELLHNWGKKP